MTEIENLAQPGDTPAQAHERLRAKLEPMGEAELLAQQVLQAGAIHVLRTLLEEGCTEQLARAMLDSLRANMKLVEDVAREKGVALLFAGEDS